MAPDATFLLHSALRGQRDSVRALLAMLTPIIQARAARALLSYGRQAHMRNIGQEVEDLTQEVLVNLFEHDAKVLRAWSPARGLSLQNYVGLIATRRTIDILRTARRSPWTEDPTEDLSLLLTADRTEHELVTRDTVSRTLSAMSAELSPQGQQLLQLCLIEDRTNQEVAEQTGLKPGAVYKWRSRLRALARRKWAEISAPRSASDAPPRTPDQRKPS